MSYPGLSVAPMSDFRLGLLWSKGHPNGGVQEIRSLGREEFDAISAASQTISRYVDRPTFVVQSENYRSVIESVSVGALPVPSFGPNSVGRHLAGQIGSRVALWLQASRMVLDQSEADIKRTFGRSSSELTEWTILRNRLNEKSFGFRLLQQVRNFLHSAPVPLAMEIFVEETERGAVQSRVLRLDEAALRRDRKLDRWLDENPEVLTEDLDIAQLVESMQLAVEELKACRLRADLPEVRLAADVIRNYAEEAFDGGDPVYSWPMIYRHEDENDAADWRSTDLFFLPLDLLPYIPEENNQHELMIPTSQGEEVVGPRAVRLQRSHQSWNTRFSVSGREGTAVGDAHVWANTTGPGWGATLFIDEGFLQPGPVQIETAEGRRARASLDSIHWQHAGENSVLIGVLIGRGAAPPSSMLTHPYRSSGQATQRM